MPQRPEDSSPWSVIYKHYDAQVECQREVVLALGNGVLVTRSAWMGAKTGEHHYPGTYRAGCYERIPGKLEQGDDPTDSLVRLPVWTDVQLRIDDGPWFDLDAVEILDYEHGLDLKHGLGWRRVVWRDAQGRRSCIEEERLVSMADPALCAMQVRVTAENWSGMLELRSGVDAGVQNENVQRFEDYEKRHLQAVRCSRLDERSLLLETGTLHSGVQLAYAWRTVADAAPSLQLDGEAPGHLIRQRLEPAQSLRMEKLVAICTSLDPDAPQAGEAAQAALQRAPGYDALRRAHCVAWQDLWQHVAIETEDPELGRFLYLHVFHLLQTISPLSEKLDVGIPARGWHGEGYRGHIFWDELFVLPFLHYRFPQLAREALLYRHRRLDAARQAARAAGYRGAMYPWRSAIDGSEVTPRLQKNLLNGQWMQDHTYRQRHIGAVIAYNVWQYYLISDDRTFLAEHGAEMMLEIARFWASIAHPAEDGRYVICGVVGPDEFHNQYPHQQEAGLNNNAYTNLMAAWTLIHARKALEALEEPARTQLMRRLQLEPEELAHWDRISRRLAIRFHHEGVIAQFEGFDRLKEFSENMLPPELRDQREDWALHAQGDKVDHCQLTKQADTLTLFYLLPYEEAAALMHRLGYPFEREQLMRTVEYYLDRTSHRSSLSATVYAGALAGEDLAQSWDFYGHALRTDLEGLKGESIAEGVHLAAMGGTLDVLQRRYLGVQAGEEGLCVEPNLPPKLERVRLKLIYRGQALQVESLGGCVRITAARSNKQAVPLMQHGQRHLLEPGAQMEFEALTPAMKA